MYETNHRRVIGIFHEYAYFGHGRSINSPAKIEWFKAKIDDKSRAIGGKQHMIALEGYVIPCEVIIVLVYVKPVDVPTEEYMACLAHVFMTDTHEWDQ
jgi:hypothetical protein